MMESIEKKFCKVKNSNIKKSILSSMMKNKKYWDGYYKKNERKLFLDSKLDRMRYYLNTKPVINSIKTIKKNINLLDKKKIFSFLGLNERKEFLFFSKKKLSNFDIIKLLYISRSLKKYFSACGYRI